MIFVWEPPERRHWTTDGHSWWTESPGLGSVCARRARRSLALFLGWSRLRRRGSGFVPVSIMVWLRGRVAESLVVKLHSAGVSAHLRLESYENHSSQEIVRR